MKNQIFPNLVKYQLYKNEIQFLKYIVLTQKIRIKNQKIEAIKNKSKNQLAKNIQVFINFANFN